MNDQPDRPDAQGLPRSERGHRRWRIFLVVCLVLAALYTAYRYALHRMVEAKLDEIRKQGCPVTLTELDKWYPQVPKEENAADIYLEAFNRYTPKQVWDTNLPLVAYFSSLPPRGKRLDDEMRAQIQRRLADNKEALQLLHKGSLIQRARYPIQLTKGNETPMPHLLNLRNGSRLLCLEAILNADQGLADNAVQSVVDTFRLAHSLDAEPVPVSFIYRFTCQENGVRGLEWILSGLPLNADQLARLGTVVDDAESPEVVRCALAGDVCFVSEELKRYQVYHDVSQALPRWWPYRAIGLLELNQLRFIDHMAELLQACQLPYPERLAAIRAVEARLDCYPEGGARQRVGEAASLVRKGDARIISRVRAARAALALEQYLIKDQGLPESLSSLVPSHLKTLPTDPYDGQPLRYKKLAKGYVVYSVGEDGKDDGGDEKKDITFTVER